MSQSEPERVFICSRFAGDIEHNIDIAKRICLMAVESGLAPFAPHLLYTKFLDDADPIQRKLGISMGLCFMNVCNEVWVYIGEGISDGMRRELQHARKLGMKVVVISEVPSCVLT